MRLVLFGCRERQSVSAGQRQVNYSPVAISSKKKNTIMIQISTSNKEMKLFGNLKCMTK
jgi:hypothetical protein